MSDVLERVRKFMNYMNEDREYLIGVNQVYSQYLTRRLEKLFPEISKRENEK